MLVKAAPANHVCGCHMTLVNRGALGYISYQKGIIQGYLVHKYASKRAPTLCSRNMCQFVLSLDVSTQTVFLYYMSVKYILRLFFFRSMLRIGYYVIMSNRWNLYNLSTLHRLYLWGHRGILVLLSIFVDWYKHSITNVAGSKCVFNRFWCIIWRPKAIFDQNVHINGLHN